MALIKVIQILSGQEFPLYVNTDFVAFIKKSTDSNSAVIWMSNNEKVWVKETVEEIIIKINSLSVHHKSVEF